MSIISGWFAMFLFCLMAGMMPDVLFAMSSESNVFNQAAFSAKASGQTSYTPKESLTSQNDLLRRLNPKITVQVMLGEALGWSGSASESAYHVIVSIHGSNTPTMVSDSEEESTPIPIARQPVRVQSQFPVNCTVERGRGSFESCTLGPGQTTSFETNDLGRISFSIPVSVHSLYSEVPVLFVQSDFMPRNQWITTHLSRSLETKLKSLVPSQILSINPSLSTGTAERVSKAVRSLMSLVDHSIPHFTDPKNAQLALNHSLPIHHTLEKRDALIDRFSARPVSLPDVDSWSKRDLSDISSPILHYEEDLNRLNTYLIDSINLHEHVSLDRKWFHGHEHRLLAQLESSKEVVATPSWFKESQREHCLHLHKRDGSRDSHTNRSKINNLKEALERASARARVLLADEHSGWAISVHNHPDQELQQLSEKAPRNMSLWATIKTKTGKFVHTLLNTAIKIWDTIIKILLNAALRIVDIVESLKELFSWEDILHTKRFLRRYYDLLAPLGPRGLTLFRTRYQGMLFNGTMATQNLFNGSISGLGGEDLTLAKLRQQSTQLVRGHPGSSTKHSDDNMSREKPHFLFGDAKTNLLHDRIMNNLPHATLSTSDSNSTIHKIQRLFTEAAHSLEKAVSHDAWEKIKPHVLKFRPGTNLFHKGLGQLLNMIRSAVTACQVFAGQALDSLLTFIPMYWELAVKIMTMPLKIPFLDKWWSKKVNRQSPRDGSLSVMDFLCLVGSIYSTWMYKIYNKGQAPFTSTDINVLESVKGPEQILYTWNNDPRTFASHNNTALRDHRLGLYDWIPRTHQTVVSAFMKVHFQAVSLFDTKSSVGSPSPKTYISQFINGVVELLGPISEYPFTQLDSADPKEIQESLDHPDIRYLNFWIAWVFEAFVRTLRPFMGKTMNQFPSTAIVNTIIVGIPSVYYETWVAYDMGKMVSRSDLPRVGVVGTYWIEILLLNFGIFWQYYAELHAFKDPFEAKLWSAWLDAAQIGNLLVRENLLIGFKVVGMLSSSYQGDSIKSRVSAR